MVFLGFFIVSALQENDDEVAEANSAGEAVSDAQGRSTRETASEPVAARTKRLKAD